eukprot:Seg2305.5 transcript_id=Seg2305.5/GoldUCD/mRNA.D3Y31 product="Zinc finger protein 862" protein_id=Seg2305.5/GoldUCD/D3Y31
MVTFIWCKLCAKHKDAILRNPLCKGNAKTAVEAYINGTNFVSKWNIDRHLEGKGHAWATEEELLLPVEERLLPSSTGAQKRPIQPRIDVALKQSTSDAYLKMIKTAYELALNPTIPLKQFKVLVKCQRQNGVVLIEGRDNNKAAQLSESRPWLLTIHCANHRIELAFKAAMNKSSFKVCDDIYRTTYQLLKNSGKLNSEVQAACNALCINGHKKLPKIHGTRFINHRRKGMRIFMDMWPALITAFENAVSRRGGVAETKAKISGLLAKLHSYEFFCKMAYYVDVLDAAVPASLIFEGNGVMPYEISESIESTAVELDHLEASAGSDEELLDSNVARHKYNEETKRVHGIYMKEGHGRNKAQNRENIEVEIQGMTYSSTGRANAAAAKKATALEVKRLLRHRFAETSSELYEALRIYDPQYWSEESNYGVSELQHLVKRFEKPLSAAGLDDKALMSE